MFALEINFNDGVSPPEIILVRRPHAIIGSSEFAHVVIEGVPSIPCELRISRGIGRQFHCQPLKKSGVIPAGVTLPEGTFTGSAQFNLGGVVTKIIALDIDLLTTPAESPDRAGVRVLRAALSAPAPLFPAVAVLGAVPIFVSFASTDPLIVGRSRKCGLRLDSSGISSEHARFGFDNGVFWVEDLGSTNGTFVGGERVSGRRLLRPEETVILGNEFALAGIRGPEDLEKLDERVVGQKSELEDEQYPCLVTGSELARPSRVILFAGRSTSIGRDPANDIWVGAPHISRNHCRVTLTADGMLQIIDQSTNGTYVNGERLTRGQEITVDGHNAIIDLKQGVQFAVCFSGNEERRFLGRDSSEMGGGEADVDFGPRVLENTADAEARRRVEHWTPVRSAAGQPDEGMRGSPSVFQTMARREGNAVREEFDGTESDWGEASPSGDPMVARTSRYSRSGIEEGLDFSAQGSSSESTTRFILIAAVGLVIVLVLIVGLWLKA